jgi:hypothetical protein
MKHLPVSSSHLKSVGYDAPSRVLEVAFHDNQRYRYLGVAAPLYQALLSAKSKGKFFAANIESKHKSVRVSPP